MATTYDDPSH